MKTKILGILSIVTFSFTVPRLVACDLCGCAVPNHPWDPRAGLFFGAAEQFTRFDTIQVEGDKIGNPAGQFMNSSITQLYLGYNFLPSFGVQVNVPLVYRSFRRTTETDIQNGKVSGLGDVSVIAHYVPFFRDSEDFTVQARIRAGVKTPTGDTSRLGEEAEEGHSRDEGEEHEHGHDDALPASAVHGHDLTLGSGSVDAIVGGSFYVRYKRVFVAGDAQYAIRTDGAYDYRFANDFSFSTGPAVYVIDQPTHTLSLHAIVSGETKGMDDFRGEPAEDTAATTIFLGPRIAATWGNRFSGEVEFDVPVSRKNSALQIVPDYRIRASLSWAF